MEPNQTVHVQYIEAPQKAGQLRLMICNEKTLSAAIGMVVQQIKLQCQPRYFCTMKGCKSWSGKLSIVSSVDNGWYHFWVYRKVVWWADATGFGMKRSHPTHLFNLLLSSLSTLQQCSQNMGHSTSGSEKATNASRTKTVLFMYNCHFLNIRR